jgi:hypothetical protein
VAWAGDRGVNSVQVTTDEGGTWREAALEVAASTLSWRRWNLEIRLPKGEWTLQCRAVDGRGDVQDANVRPPHPSGASGYHTVTVNVR